MKIKAYQLAKELNITTKELFALADQKLTTGFTGRTSFSLFTEEAADSLRLAKEAPMAVSDKLFGRVVAPCRNPSWVYVKMEGIHGKHIVHISRRHSGMLVGKRIAVEKITDANGTTYRHDPRRV